MIRRGLAGALGASVVLGLTLSGCVTINVTPPTTSPSASETPSATPEPTEDPVASGPLGPEDAYTRCVTLTADEMYAGEDLTIAPYADADVIPRSDGLFYVYAEVTVNGESDPEQRDIAFECILGGTFEEPNDALYGKRPRAPLSERQPDSPLSVED